MLPAAQQPTMSSETSDLASRYVMVDSLPWVPTKFPGVHMKVLMQNEPDGMLTTLFKFDPDTRLPFHEHVEIEQTFVLEGSLEDHEGNATAGNFVWRPKGNRHDAYSPRGAIVLSFFLAPNKFLDSVPA